MSRVFLNRMLCIVIAILALLAWTLRRDVTQPNYVFTPEMVFSVPYDSFAANPIFRDGKTMQLPVAGTVARDATLFEYDATEADALRASEELTNPWNARRINADELLAAKNRGRIVYSTFCLPCHGAVGNADGPVATRGFLGVTPFTSETSLKMSDGQMFHVVTFGQQYIETPQKKHMPGYAAQISEEDRWKVILHVRSLQDAAVRKVEAERIAKASIEAGKQIFVRLNCNKCHTVSAGEKPVGPFLGKVVQVYSREQLHEAILHPSRTIAQGFLSQVFLMTDGTTLSGFVTGETAEQLTIRNTEGNEIILQVDEIEERRTLEKSPMPDGIIEDLADDELQSLLDYLKSLAADSGPVEPASAEPDNGPANGPNNATDNEQVIPNSLRDQK